MDAKPIGISVIQVDPAVDETLGVRMAVWQPVERQGTPATLGDLSRLVCPGTDNVGDCFRDLRQPTGLQDNVSLTSVQLDALSRVGLEAGIGSVRVNRRLPTVVLTGSIRSRSAEFIELAQAVAKRGIVAAIVIPPFEPARPEFSLTEAEMSHARLSRSIARLANDGILDPARVALTAWSFGGVPAMLEAMSNPSVRAVVSLDSAVRYKYGVELIRSARAYRPLAFRGSLLSLVAGEDNPVEKSDVVLQALANATVRSVTVQGLRHGDFSDLYAALPMRVSTMPETREQERLRRRSDMLRLAVDFLEVNLLSTGRN
jgi:hypothetical protein